MAVNNILNIFNFLYTNTMNRNLFFLTDIINNQFNGNKMTFSMESAIE